MGKYHQKSISLIVNRGRTRHILRVRCQSFDARFAHRVNEGLDLAVVLPGPHPCDSLDAAGAGALAKQFADNFGSSNRARFERAVVVPRLQDGALHLRLVGVDGDNHAAAGAIDELRVNMAVGQIQEEVVRVLRKTPHSHPRHPRTLNRAGLLGPTGSEWGAQSLPDTKRVRACAIANGVTELTLIANQTQQLSFACVIWSSCL